jgi:hypothetical protein
VSRQTKQIVLTTGMMVHARVWATCRICTQRTQQMVSKLLESEPKELRPAALPDWPRAIAIAQLRQSATAASALGCTINCTLALFRAAVAIQLGKPAQQCWCGWQQLALPAPAADVEQV